MSRAQMLNYIGIIYGNNETKGLSKSEYEIFKKEFIKHKNISKVLKWMSETPYCFNVKSAKKTIIEDVCNKYNIDTTDVKTKKDMITKLYKSFDNDLPGIDRGCKNKTRLDILKQKYESSLLEKKDTIYSKYISEKYLLGTSLSCSVVDDIECPYNIQKCLELEKAINKSNFLMCVIIDNVKKTKTKRGKSPGQEMCFLTVSDHTYSLDNVVVFPDIYNKYKKQCIKDNIVFMTGVKQNNSMVIDSISKVL